MGKIRILLVFFMIFGAVALIPFLYAIASSPAIQSTAWGASFLIWYAETENAILAAVDTGDSGPGWELFIVALTIFLIPLCVYKFVTIYDETRTIRRRTLEVKAVIQESSLLEKVVGTMVYNVSITYQFTAEGKTITKTDMLSDMWSNLLGEHQKRLQQYPSGAKIAIHYEPGNLDNHVFEKFDEPSNRWMIAVGFCLGGGLYLLFAWLTGIFLTLYLKNFPIMDLDRQIITGVIAGILFVIFFIFSRWIYVKGMATPSQQIQLLEKEN